MAMESDISEERRLSKRVDLPTLSIRILIWVAALTVFVLVAGCADARSTPTPQPIRTPTVRPAVPGAPGLGDPIFPQAGNGGYDAQHYVLDLTVDVERNLLTGTVTMTAQSAQALSAFNLDFAGMTVDRVAVNAQPAAYERDERELIVRPAHVLAAGEPFTTAVSYHGTPEAGGAWHHQEGAIFVTGEPVGAATWYPVNNHPLDKATYTFRITSQRPYMAVANGRLRDVVEEEKGNTYIWEMEQPMASYLSTVYVADLAVQGGEDLPNLSIQNYVPPRLAPEVSELFETQDEMIGFFTERFGPYPFTTYGAAVVDAEWGGALETQSVSLFGRSGLLVDLPADIDLPLEASAQTLIAHELAHQWFGDSVSLKSWQDVWLKEGVATYVSWLWLEHVEGEEALRGIIERRYAAVAQAIGGRIFDFSENPTPFDTLSGPEVLAWLRSLGAEALASRQALAEALANEVPAGDGGEVATAPENLTDAQIEQIIEILPEGDLSGEGMLEVLEALPGDQFSGRQMFQALVVLQIYDVAGMSVFQGERIAAPATPPADNLFNVSTYDRGALTLHALRLRVGDEDWFQIMRTYYARYKNGNAGTADFIEVAEEVSGQDLDAFFDGWLYQKQMPGIEEMDLTMGETESAD